MIGVHVEISNVCSLLLCVSENGGCAGVTERRPRHIFLRRVARSYYSVSTALHLRVSFFGSYALWLAFNTAVAFILVFAFGDA